jgi:4-aminobutyrate aminotransferase-like enzyme/Ser/Thr protein kinase RdoA (MazF antagonist)
MSRDSRRRAGKTSVGHVDRDRLADILAGAWGIAGEVSELGSFEDRIFAVDSEGGRLAMKLIGRERASNLELEHAAMRCLASSDFPYDVPELVSTADAQPADTVDVDGLVARVLTWIPGRPLSDMPHLDRAALVGLGRLAGRANTALARLEPSHKPGRSKWDPRHATEVVAGLLELVTDDERSELTRAVEPLAALPQALSDALPCQTIHADITDFNVICRMDENASVIPTGLIDFGDATWSWRACELAVTCEAVAAREPSSPLAPMLAVLAAFRQVQNLDEAEVDVLWPLILGRAASCAALSRRHLQGEPTPYLQTMHALDWAALRGLLALPEGLAAAAIRSAFDLSPVPRGASIADQIAAMQPTSLLGGVLPRELQPVDLSLTGTGATTPEVNSIAVGRWGEIRLANAHRPAHEPPATLRLGADVFAAQGTIINSPLRARVEELNRDEIVLALQLQTESIYLRLAGINPAVTAGQELAHGDQLGTIASPTSDAPAHLRVQLSTSKALPGLAVPLEHQLQAWLALCPDPSPLLGIDAAAPAPSKPETETQRRSHVLAKAQKLYYEHPIPIVRGWRQYLYDAYGRPYLDMVNNVASVGHSHPRITAAANRQLQLLNTNSRFLYDSMTAYAERIVALLPTELDTVFLVNSGSEACDLAVQLARVYTGRRDMVTLAGAYHGWTSAVYELCSSPADNPGWGATIPSFVHVAEQPDPYRGRFGAQVGPYVRSVEEACERANQWGGIAGFISEPLLGNQGALTPPPGYLHAAYTKVRQHGGLCIADEIQVGYGRTGQAFWAFEHEDVVPDIVVAAKAAGNGHPVGIVVCRKEIADAFGRRASFFSSTGGGPVTCEIGLAVLDAMRDERLQENAAEVGAKLKQQLEILAKRHPLIGAVHGRGLYLGVDLVRDRETKEPWAGAAHRVCERMREFGVIVQPTGDAANVLKVKPPLCITAQDADYFTASLDEALSELEQVIL